MIFILVVNKHNYLHSGDKNLELLSGTLFFVLCKAIVGQTCVPFMITVPD